MSEAICFMCRHAEGPTTISKVITDTGKVVFTTKVCEHCAGMLEGIESPRSKWVAKGSCGHSCCELKEAPALCRMGGVPWA